MKQIRKVLVVFALFAAALAHAGESSDSVWHFKGEVLQKLTQSVPAILRRQDKTTGRFRAAAIWLPGDQMVIYELAAAWAFKDEHNPFYHDGELLNAIMRGGEALIPAQDNRGRWEFRKRDNSTWGMHFDPWVYSRWVRAYNIIRDAMPTEQRARWQKALELGYSGIAKSELSAINNIASHHAMGLYIAGKSLSHPEWCEQASAFLIRVALAQNTNGFWSEHCGPVVHYNIVYVDALGVYYALSHDTRVKPALERAARFQSNFTYPDGSYVETVDERNPYLSRTESLNVGFSFSAIGRGYLRELWNANERRGTVANTDGLASMLLYGEEGECEEPALNRVFITDDAKAAVTRQGDWCGVLSAYVCPLSQSRWIQDRQNFVSVFNNRTGLILGGGNTKLQPMWSTFTVGDTGLLKHRAGDERPKFVEPPGLLHVPTSAKLDRDGHGLNLDYGDTACRVVMRLIDSHNVRLTYSVAHFGERRPVEAHVTLLPVLTEPLRMASGQTTKLTSSPIDLSAKDVGNWFDHNGWRISMPAGSTLRWPVLPHNPYRKDGHADLSEGRVVITLPFGGNITTQTVVLTLLK